MAGSGSFRDQLTRLPAVGPGDLPGRLMLVVPGCDGAYLDLATLRTANRCGVEGVVDGGLVVEPHRVDLHGNPTSLIVSDLAGHRLGTIRVPTGWDWWVSTRRGVVLCQGVGGSGARYRLFSGGTVRLPSCPLAALRDRLVFASADGRSLVDDRGATVVDLHRRLRGRVEASLLSSGVLAVADHPAQGSQPPIGLYRGNRYLRSVPVDPLGAQHIESSSRDGGVVVVADGQVGGGFLVLGPADAAPRRVRSEYGRSLALASPDGRFTLFNADGVVVVVDPATLTPLMRLDFDQSDAIYDWRP